MNIAKNIQTRQIKAGIAGCGNISKIYLNNLTRCWPWLCVEACSDIIEERSREKTKLFNIPKYCTTEELLADSSIDIVLNLTTPDKHAELNER
ncbi:MAG: Gfo/Idh/MocA family oxidoreductase, partial [bacterium]